MGMAASQVRFLQLTGRKHDISRELQHLSLEKMALTRDMQTVTRDYQLALSSKSLKWSNNAGVTYTDISYSTLMRPNALNAKSPILVSDENGRIVLDNKYKKYAERLDVAGGKWEDPIKSQILAELTGISQGDIDLANKTAAAATTALTNYENLRDDLSIWKSKEESKAGTQYLTIDKLAKNLGSVNGKDLANLYTKRSNGDYSIKKSADIETLGNGIKNNLSKYFVDDETYLRVTDKKAFETACDDFVNFYKTKVDNMLANPDKSSEADGLKGDIGDWTIDISEVLSFIMAAYRDHGGSHGSNSTTDENTYPLRDTTSSNWTSWYDGLVSRQQAVDAGKTEYETAMASSNQLMTAEQETQLRYFDLLFQSIADNGWTYDSQIEDSEYLSQMFQNNNYYVTTITENRCFDSTIPLSERNYKYSYDTNIASNFDNIFAVNDSDARDEALVDYEYKKGIINAKESRIDTRMKNLETEQSAITKMLESIDQVKNDNIERTFGIWG